MLVLQIVFPYQKFKEITLPIPSGIWLTFLISNEPFFFFFLNYFMVSVFQRRKDFGEPVDSVLQREAIHTFYS